MRLLVILMFLPFVSDAQLLITKNENGILYFNDSSLAAAKVAGLSTLINAKANQAALDSKSTIYFGVDAQANDSYVITASPIPSAYTTGMVVIFKATTANTTGCTINVNGLGAKTIVKRVSTTMATGDILANMFCWIVYDGTNFVMINPVVN